MARKILTVSLNKEGKGAICMIVPDFNPSSHREDKFKLKVKRRLYWLRFKAELLATKLNLKHKHAKKTLDDFTKACDDLANDVLLEPVKDFKPEVIDGRAVLYEGLKRSIDEGKPIMYVDLSEEK